MRLICGNCDAQYEVGAEMIPPEGRDVQCSACDHIWFEPGRPVVAEPEPPRVIPRRIPVPPPPASAADDFEDDDPVLPPLSQTDLPPLRRAPLDEEMLAVLREEAERETAARAAEAAARSQPPSEAPPPEAPSAAAWADAPAPEAADAEETVWQDRPAETPETETTPEPEPTVPPGPGDLFPPVQDTTTRAEPLFADDVPEVEEAHFIHEPAPEPRPVTPGEAPETDSPPAPPPEAPVTRPSRRDLLPDIEQINSTLDGGAQSDFIAGDALRQEKPASGGFGRGFALMMLLTLLLALAYVKHSELSAALPAAEPWLSAYAERVDELRSALAGLVSGFLKEGA